MIFENSCFFYFFQILFYLNLIVFNFIFSPQSQGGEAAPKRSQSPSPRSERLVPAGGVHMQDASGGVNVLTDHNFVPILPRVLTLGQFVSQYTEIGHKQNDIFTLSAKISSPNFAYNRLLPAGQNQFLLASICLNIILHFHNY